MGKPAPIASTDNANQYLDILAANASSWPAMNAKSLQRVRDEATTRGLPWALVGTWRADRAFDSNREAYTRVEQWSRWRASGSLMLLANYRSGDTSTREPWLAILRVDLASLEKVLADRHATFAFWADPVSDTLLAFDGTSRPRNLGRYHPGVMAQQIVEHGNREFVGFEDPMQPWSGELPLSDNGTCSGVPTTRSAKETVKSVFASLDDRFAAEDGVWAIRTGLSGLDAVGGLECGELCVVAGPAGSGKTALMMAVARTATNAGAHGLYVTLHESDRALGERMLLAETSVPTERLRLGQLKRTDMTELTLAAATLAKRSLSFNDGGQGVMSAALLREIVSRWRSGVSEPRVFVIVDYVELLRDASCALALHDIAREHRVALFVVSQTMNPPSPPHGHHDGRCAFRNLAAATFILHAESRDGGSHWLEHASHRHSRRIDEVLHFNSTLGRFESIPDRRASLCLPSTL